MRQPCQQAIKYPTVDTHRREIGEHHLDSPEVTLHVLECQLIVPGIAQLPAVNHSVDMQTCIIREANIAVTLCQEVNDFSHASSLDVFLVQSAAVVQNHLRAVTRHHRVFNFALLELLAGNYLVGLDIAVPLLVGHADVDLHETILARSSHNCFECCHLLL